MVANSRLTNLFKLGSKVTIYVPSTIDININIDTTEYVENTATLLSTCFGGATSTEALGYWVSPTSGLVKEKSIMVFGYCKEADLEAHIEDIIDWCEKMKADLKQDAIALEINGEMYFI